MPMPLRMARINEDLAGVRSALDNTVRRLSTQQEQAQREIESVRARLLEVLKPDTLRRAERLARLTQRLETLERGVTKEQTACVQALEQVLAAVNQGGDKVSQQLADTHMAHLAPSAVATPHVTSSEASNANNPEPFREKASGSSTSQRRDSGVTQPLLANNGSIKQPSVASVPQGTNPVESAADVRHDSHLVLLSESQNRAEISEADTRESTTTNRKADAEAHPSWPAPGPASFYRPKLPLVFDISTPQALRVNSSTSRNTPTETLGFLPEASSDLTAEPFCIDGGTGPDGAGVSFTSTYAREGAGRGAVVTRTYEGGAARVSVFN